jgi:hypothetical protein
MSKTAQLLAHLQAGRAVTRATALVAFKIANISAEISTLRRKGYTIEATTGDDGTGSRYTKWHLIASPRRTKRAATRRASSSKGI